MGILFGKPKGNEKKERVPDRPDTVYLYQFSRWAHGPCQSMPCMRVECFLRLYKIPHVIVPSMKSSSTTGRWPWARYNGTVVSDSQLIIDHVMAARGIKEDFLTAEQEGVALAIERMLDFHVYPFAVRWSWVDNFSFIQKFSVLKIGGPQFLKTWLLKYIRGNLITYLNTGGWGEYTDTQYRQQWCDDVAAIGKILGTKPFLFGEKMTRTDASVYAFMQAYIDLPAAYQFSGITAIVGEGTALNSYLRRCEAQLYPDMAAIKARAGSLAREEYPAAIGQS